MFAAITPAIRLTVNIASGKVLLALLPLFVLLAGLIVYCLVDLFRARSVRYLPKPASALIILLVSAPFGALAYLIFGKDRHGDDLAETDGDERSFAGPASERAAARR